MGTRNLTCVVKDGEFKVAQYGQWDGYPSGQGMTCLDFLRNWDRDQFSDQIDACIPQDKDEIQAFCESIGAKDGWMNTKQSDKFKTKYPQLSRDMGAKILQFIADSKEPVQLNNNVEFAADGLFCEWVWVIDLDKNTFECYMGFNQNGHLPESERFAFLDKTQDGDKDYYPPLLKASWQLASLPSNEQFLSDCGNEVDDD
jgi:hypothetical protein